MHTGIGVQIQLFGKAIVILVSGATGKLPLLWFQSASGITASNIRPTLSHIRGGLGDELRVARARGRRLYALMIGFGILTNDD